MTTGAVVINALTQAECKEGSKELDENQSTADANDEIFVVVEIVNE
jgi:hypothetical protein